MLDVPCWFFTLYLIFEFGSKSWCPSAMRNYKRSIYLLHVILFLSFSLSHLCKTLYCSCLLLLLGYWVSENMVAREVSDCRMVLQSGKNCVGPVSRLKESKGQNCWSCLCNFLLAAFYSGYGCKIWCSSVTKILKRLILNLACVHPSCQCLYYLCTS